MTTFRLTEVKADLFHVPQTYSLAYSSNADFYAAKGTLEWQFAIIFGQIDELTNQHICSGNVAVLEDNARFIYLLVTRDNMYQKSSYENLEAALICLRHHMRNHGATKVAMPRLCCDSEGLQWSRVKEIILRVFANEYNTEIMICDHHVPQQTALKCRIIEYKEQHFEVPANCSLIHSVSADFVMCRSIGVQFNCKCGQGSEQLRQDKHLGSVAVHKDNGRFIYNLVIKERNHERCTYIALYHALTATRDHMRQHKVTKLAIPRLGCGIDRLDWLRMKDILELVFADDDVEIISYSHDSFMTVPGKDGHVHCALCKRIV